ncbi:uncharacterized protein [Palaemon carinicauda]|uniref:uncharacterized protein n=1 Tax=Palaemon carinicauda TaxID=392227 RepID=UPI0035B69DED
MTQNTQFLLHPKRLRTSHFAAREKARLDPKGRGWRWASFLQDIKWKGRKSGAQFVLRRLSSEIKRMARTLMLLGALAVLACGISYAYPEPVPVAYADPVAEAYPDPEAYPQPAPVAYADPEAYPQPGPVAYAEPVAVAYPEAGPEPCWGCRRRFGGYSSGGFFAGGFIGGYRRRGYYWG